MPDSLDSEHRQGVLTGYESTLQALLKNEKSHPGDFDYIKSVKITFNGGGETVAIVEMRDRVKIYRGFGESVEEFMLDEHEIWELQPLLQQKVSETKKAVALKK